MFALIVELINGDAHGEKYTQLVWRLTSELSPLPHDK